MRVLSIAGALLFAALPATTNYQLNSYGFTSGGGTGSTATYSLEGSVGEISGKNAATANATTKPGYVQVQQAHVPTLSALDTNGGLYYNKLHFVIDQQGNPSDAKYLISVSTDNFASNVTYLQPDGTLTTTLALTQYQTYAAWGGASGGLMIGLDPATSYSVKLKATQGKLTESAFGPVTTTATVAQSLTFNLATSSQASPPFSVSFGSLSAGSLTNSLQTINTGLSTNGAAGASIYISSQNGGLLSGSTGSKIDAVSTDLGSASRGFGAQSSSATQTSGGPFTVVSPYNGSGNNVGVIGTTTRSLYSSTAPITSAVGILSLKAKAAQTDVAASDYQEIITFTAAGNF
ncbi:MAG: hypothetical protein JWM81_1124 [Candidatus Saccharibacteria bacterium]|nr:hypothetical protein [Candidatus Saccharibacteria bacterium]